MFLGQAMGLRHVAVSLSLCTVAFGGLVQKPNLIVPPSHRPYRDEVKQMFTDSYGAYKKYAWGFDDLYPLNKSGGNTRNGWGAAIVDSLSTMHVMGFEDLFVEGVEYASNIDFSVSKVVEDKVSVFETTIRYLGGLLSAYELSGKKYPALLANAQTLADKLAFAWVGKNNIPHGWMNFTDNSIFIERTNIAEAGTLLLEWETLSKHTGNATYAELTLRSQRHIASLPSPFPGLAVTWVDPTLGEWIGGYITWGGGADSYYEYLIKHARLSNTDDLLFADVWAQAIDSSIQNLMKKPTVGNVTYIADFDSQKRFRYVGSHLACFHAGNWIYGGRLVDNQTIVDYGLELLDGCWNTYIGTATGIGPESFGYITEEGEFTGDTDPITDEKREFFNITGFYTRSADYVLRPEVLESNFYAWRATGDVKYLDRAKLAIKSFQRHLKIADISAYSGVDDVNQVDGTKQDYTESFWYAETLKYLFLTFDDPNHISLDEYVFNTEAHPFKAPPPKGTYSSRGLRRPAPKPFELRGKSGTFTYSARPGNPTAGGVIIDEF